MLDFDSIPHGVKLKEALAWTLETGERFGLDTQNFLQLGPTPAKQIFRENSLRVLKYSPATGKGSKSPIVIIPSLINRYYVLDLLPKKSFIEYLLSEDFPVYVIEWGPPEDEDRWLTLDRLISGRVRRAVQKVLQNHGGEQVHLFGHCLGGTLATIFSLRYPEKIASLTLLTSPVDFETGGQLSAWARHPGFNVDAFVEAYGNSPWTIMLASFQMLKPAAGFSKWLKIRHKLSDANFVRNFFALEAWAFDNISFPGACYKALIKDFYRDNALLHGEVKVADRKVRLDQLSFPVLNICSNADHIVPPKTTLSAEHLPEDRRHLLTYWLVEGGHVGAVIGGRAQKQVWPDISNWLRDQESLPPPPLSLQQ